MYNGASIIVKNIFSPGIENVFSENAVSPLFVFSPVSLVDVLPGGQGTHLKVVLSGAGGSHVILLYFNGLDEAGVNRLTLYGKTLPPVIRMRAGIVFRRSFSVSVLDGTRDELPRPAGNARHAVIRLLGGDDRGTRDIVLYVPLLLLALLSTDVLAAEDGCVIENCIISHFNEPSVFFPELKIILDSLEDWELQRLFSLLMQNRLLSVYQICLIIIAMPEHSLRVKHSLSSNTLRDVLMMLKTLKGEVSVGKRDLTGGIYSVEDAVYRIMGRGTDTGYSAYLLELQSMFADLEAMEILLMWDFQEWLGIMEDDGLLYHTLAGVPERDVSRCLSGEVERFEEMLRRHLSSRRVADIIDGSKSPVSFSEKCAARSALIAKYRSLRIRRRNWGGESFEHVLRSITEPSGYRRLLMAAGWFTLSTALKNTRIDLVKRVTDPLPTPARYLIEDVLRGVINPNILHDELQINDARTQCVRSILSLYEDGLIDLHL